MKHYYTYTYFSADDPNTPTYVGKGSGARFLCHMKAKSYFGNHLRSQIALGVEPKVVLTLAGSEEAAFEEEKRLILLYGRKNLGTGTLYNLTDGGDGLRGLTRSPSHCAAISKALAGRKHNETSRRNMSVAHQGKKQSDSCRLSHTGWKQTEETKELLRQMFTGVPRPPEVRAAISKAKKGKPMSAEHRAAIAKSWEKRRAKSRGVV